MIPRQSSLTPEQEDAKRIVQFSKYPPVGSRGFGPMFAPVILGHETESAYAEHANEQLMVIVQMESKGGVAECEKIAAVEGIDCLFIGTSVFSPLLPSPSLLLPATFRRLIFVQVPSILPSSWASRERDLSTRRPSRGS